MENSILNFVGFLETVDFALFAKFIGMFYVIFWLFIVSWVWFDSRQRYNSLVLVIFSVLSVLVFNLFGLIIYLIVRPRYTKEELESYSREKLNLIYESEGIGYCPICDSIYYPDFVYCKNCGNELRVKCKNCGVYIDKDWKYCPYCENKNVKKERDSSLNSNAVSELSEMEDVKSKRGNRASVRLKGFFSKVKNLFNKLISRFWAFFDRVKPLDNRNGSKKSSSKVVKDSGVKSTKSKKKNSKKRKKGKNRNKNKKARN